MISGEWKPGYQPALQGVRAVAVLAVFAFHVGVIRGGWLGVEAFFVLSGFLITLLLLGEMKPTGRVRVGRFYLRRAARLLPAVLLMLVALLAFCVVAHLEVRLHQRAALASLFYYANWSEVGGANLGGLGHMWSLSIEEQFYALWPLALFIAARWLGSRGVAVIAGAGFLLSVIERLALSGRGDWFDRVYYASDTRAAGLLVGCFAAALLFRSRGALAGQVPVVAPLVLLIPVGAAVLLVGNESAPMWRYGVTLFDVAVAVILVSLVSRRHLLARALSWRPLVYVGEISYGVYLWHLPVIVAAAATLHGPARMAVQVAVPFLLAAVSYRFVETPIRRWAHQRTADRSEPVGHEPARSGRA